MANDRIIKSMPIIKSAKKKMRQDKKRTAHNKELKDTIKGLVKTARRTPSVKSLQEVQSSLDKAVKTNLLHANKAARLKSRLSKLVSTQASSAK